MRLLPRDHRFFDRFTVLAAHTSDAARHLVELLSSGAGGRADLVDTIKRLERQADEVTYDVVTQLDRTFITPLDREDIHLLASRLDDVIDSIDGIARRSQIFRLGPSPEGAVRMAGVIHQACGELEVAAGVLGKRQVKILLQACHRIKDYEEEGDVLYHEWLGRLFEEPGDPVHLVKWKEIYDSLEKTLDTADDVANVLESVAIKHA